jgi:hypothetical protein
VEKTLDSSQLIKRAFGFWLNALSHGMSRAIRRILVAIRSTALRSFRAISVAN